MMMRMSMFGLLGYEPSCNDGEDVYVWHSLENSLEKMTFKKSFADFVFVVFRSYESSCSNGEHVDVWCFCRIVWRR